MFPVNGQKDSFAEESAAFCLRDVQYMFVFVMHSVYALCWIRRENEDMIS